MPRFPKVTKKDAGYYLRVWRAERDLSIRQAAKVFGIGNSHMSLIEAGKRWASPETAQVLAEATGQPLSLFLYFGKAKR